MEYAAALMLILATAAQAQTGASRLMLATVTDTRGRAIVDLGPDDFVVQEGAATREILSVRVADYPIVVVLETSGASVDDFSLLQRAAAHFIERLGNDRPVIIASGGTTPRLVATFDDDRKTVLERLNALEPARSPPGAALAGPALAAQTLHATGTLFSSIVLLSLAPGDNAATDVPAAIIESGAIVHAIAQEAATGSGYRVAGSGLGSGFGSMLRNLVNQTRGEFTPIYSAASFQAALDRLVDRLGSEMLIEYLVPPGSKPIDPKVGIRVPGARVRGLGVAPK